MHKLAATIGKAAFLDHEIIISHLRLGEYSIWNINFVKGVKTVNGVKSVDSVNGVKTVKCVDCDEVNEVH